MVPLPDFPFDPEARPDTKMVRLDDQRAPWPLVVVSQSCAGSSQRSMAADRGAPVVGGRGEPSAAARLDEDTSHEPSSGWLSTRARLSVVVRRRGRTRKS